MAEMTCQTTDIQGMSHVLLTGDWSLPPLFVVPKIPGAQFRCLRAHTGATGFLGSVVLERLMSKVPKMSRITVIVRDKKGLTGRPRSFPIFSLRKTFDACVLTPGPAHSPGQNRTFVGPQRPLQGVEEVKT